MNTGERRTLSNCKNSPFLCQYNKRTLLMALTNQSFARALVNQNGKFESSHVRSEMVRVFAVASVVIELEQIFIV